MDDYKEDLKAFRRDHRAEVRENGSSELVDPVKPLRLSYVVQLSDMKVANPDQDGFNIDDFRISEVRRVSDDW